MINAWHLLWIVPACAFVGLVAEGLLNEAKNDHQNNDSENSK